VDAAAAAGDGEARQILERHAAALVSAVAAVARALELQAPPVASLGGAITHLEQLRLPFARELAARLPQATWAVPAGDAASGALAIAHQLHLAAD
jgi:glucosamine kinase